MSRLLNSINWDTVGYFAKWFIAGAFLLFFVGVVLWTMSGCSRTKLVYEPMPLPVLCEEARKQCPQTPPIYISAPIDRLVTEKECFVVGDYSPIYFDTDSYGLSQEALNRLSLIAGALFNCPDMVVYLVGHADSRGSDDYNWRLAVRRVLSVKDYLEWCGVDEERIMAVGKGEVLPFATGQSEDFWGLNRRVEIHVQ